MVVGVWIVADVNGLVVVGVWIVVVCVVYQGTAVNLCTWCFGQLLDTYFYMYSEVVLYVEFVIDYVLWGRQSYMKVAHLYFLESCLVCHMFTL